MTSRSRRTQRSRRRRSPKRSRPHKKTYHIVIPHPERRNRDLTLNLPSPYRCLSPRKKSPLYCGDKPYIPDGYQRRAKPYECLRKGFGAGMCSIYKRV